ncbi:hypothetical protein AU476_06320 [Cupriavidus sp. UYMSc13B]|nr:hypothetical protein AU476_06320 [Cupriavidus sp. UYMSc13B]
MTRLIKVTFTSTTGVETTGFASLHGDDTIDLPNRMMLRVTSAINAGEGYAIRAHRNGYSYQLRYRQGATYQLDAKHATSDRWLTRLADAFEKPSKDQLQAYGRYCHTLSAAAAVGLAGYAAGAPAWTATMLINAGCLLVSAALLLAISAVLSGNQ